MKVSSYKDKVRRAAEREDRRERRGRIEHVLIQKLQRKHRGTRQKWPKPVIKRAVAAYLDANTSFVDAWTDLRDMDIIVDRISPTLGNFVEKKAATAAAAAAAAQKKDSVALLIGNGDDVNTSISTKSQSTVLANVDHNDAAKWKEMNPWVKMSLAKTVEAEDAERLEKERKATRRQVMTSNLNDQLARKKLAEQAKAKEYDAFVASKKHELELWQKQATEERKREEYAMKRAAKDIKVQINEHQERKRAEQEKCRLREQQEIEEMKRKLEQEEDKKRKIKEQEKEKWDKIKLENGIKLKERERKKEEEAALDAKLMADMKARLDKEEADRAQALADRLQRNEEFAKKLKEAATYQEDVEKRLEEERAVLREMEARECKERERECRKKEALKKQQEMILETNKQMADEKRRALKELERSEEAYAAQCKREAEAVLAEENAKQMKKDQLKKQNSKVLKKQIDEQEQLKAVLMSDMNEVERSINKELMAKIEKDPILRKKILTKFNASQSATVAAAV